MRKTQRLKVAAAEHPCGEMALERQLRVQNHKQPQERCFEQLSTCFEAKPCRCMEDCCAVQNPESDLQSRASLAHPLFSSAHDYADDD